MSFLKIKRLSVINSIIFSAWLAIPGHARCSVIQVNASQVLHPISPHLTGACLEDVNHEVYGGLYSQMIFGESFQEPSQSALLLTNFTNYGGSGSVAGGVLSLNNGSGPKLIYNGAAMSGGDISAQLRFSSNEGGDAGFIFQVTEAATGADNFNGYEVSLSPNGYLVLGRHRQNWEPISQVSVPVPLNQWINLEVEYTNASINILVNGSSQIQYTDTQYPLISGQVGLRDYSQDVQFQNFNINGANIALTGTTNALGDVSGMWNAVTRGSATGQYILETTNVFVGSRCQRITYAGGTGAFGIANQGLNRWGMNFIASHEYDGCLDVRADNPVQLTLVLENADGTAIYAQTNVLVTSNNWEHLCFSLTPSASDTDGRFTVELTQPGSAVLGYAFLQPGAWGQFHGLPVRQDVAQGLIDQGVTVLRYGGSMVNAAAYRWKNMTGPRDRRPPYHGTWYTYASDGWGIPDFLNFCEAAGFLGIPDFNVNETPQDMADFMQYVNGATNTTWGAQRAADGHPQPYGLKYLELGNEEAVNNTYYQKFQALARSIWAADSNVVLVVGDFSYSQIITNPYSFGGAASGITSLTAQQQILQLANQNNREVWFDVHVWDDGPTVDPSLNAMFSFDTALGEIAGGAKYNVVVFELNANHHGQGRALGNALAINAAERDGRLPVVTSANCLQPDGENDNGWDQGLLFLNPSQVWLQPPGYVTQMFSQNYVPQEIWSSVTDSSHGLDVSAECSPDGSHLVLKVVNTNGMTNAASINLFGFAPTNALATIQVLSAGLSAVNTAQNPANVTVLTTSWPHQFTNNTVTYNFAPYSVTVLSFQGRALSKTPPVLKHRYSFNDAAGSKTIADSVGSQNGIFFGASGGVDGNGNLILNGTNAYVSLGPGLITGYTNLTVEAWMSVDPGDPGYARLFDFGATDSNTGLGAYGLDFCPNSGSGSWFEVFGTDPGAGNAQQLPGASFAGGGLIHVVVVYDPQLPYTIVYTNGVTAGMASINIPFSSLQDDHNYLGRSGYNNDPYLSGTIQEFRVYSGDMNAAQAAADYLAGPDNVDTNFNLLTGISLNLPVQTTIGQKLSATITAHYQNGPDLNVAFANPVLLSGNTNVLQVGGDLTLTAINPGMTTVTASYGGLYATQSVTVSPPPLVLTHRYEFKEPAGSLTFTDSVGSANGTVNGSASLNGNSLLLPGGSSPNNNNYGSLPAGLIAGYTSLTIECWVTFGSNATWGRLIDIGDTDSETGNGAYCLDFTPHSGFSPAGVNFEIADTDPGYNDAQDVAVSPVLDNSGEIHLVLVYDPPSNSLLVYTNGILMAQNTGVTIPMSAIHPVHCYLGKSSYAGDPNGTATLNELRIYNGAMSAMQVAADFAAGPDVLSGPEPVLSISRAATHVILNWPAASAGYVLQTTPNLKAGWTTLFNTQLQIVTNGNYQITLPATDSTVFYRLTD